MTTRKEQKLINAQSMASNFESEQASILVYSGYSLQVVTTGTAVGVLRIYTSNDEEGVTSANSNMALLQSPALLLGIEFTLQGILVGLPLRLMLEQ